MGAFSRRILYIIRVCQWAITCVIHFKSFSSRVIFNYEQFLLYSKFECLRVTDCSAYDGLVCEWCGKRQGDTLPKCTQSTSKEPLV